MSIGKAVSAVDKVVPISMLTNAVTRTPLGMAFRAGLGAVKAAADGRNIFQGAVRSLAPDLGTRFFVDTAMAAARGEHRYFFPSNCLAAATRRCGSKPNFL